MDTSYQSDTLTTASKHIHRLILVVQIREIQHATYQTRGNAECRWLFFDNLIDLQHYSLGCHFFRVYSMNSFLDLDSLLCFVVLFPAILILLATLWIVSQERNYQLLGLSVLGLYRVLNICQKVSLLHVLLSWRNVVPLPLHCHHCQQLYPLPIELPQLQLLLPLPECVVPPTIEPLQIELLQQQLLPPPKFGVLLPIEPPQLKSLLQQLLLPL